ncbi:MAG: SprB repeat-containing protein [Sphingobacteriales bacterium]|nr:SprB repeat-containing protein [Sphingobacteriales bacterium]
MQGQQLQLTGSTNISATVTYQWIGPNGYSSSQQNPTINNPVAGNYNLIVTALSGTCPSPPATVNVTVVSISPNINSQDPSCAGGNNGAVQVNPTPNGLAPFTYQWNNNAGGGTSNTVTGLGAGGPYTVLITSTSGCTATASATLTAPPPLTIGTNAQNPSCNGGNDGGALVLAAGGVGGYTYQWSGGSNPNSSTTGGLLAGTYTVTVTSGTCSSTATVALTNPPPTTANIAVTNPNCAGGTGSATAQYNGGIPNTYQWSAGTGNGPTHNNIPAGAISVTITDANGCSATATNNLVAPPLLTAAITTQNPTCASNNNGGVQATANGGTSPYTFVWSSGQTNFQVGNLGAGTYIVTVTDNKGCTATANAAPTAPPAIVGNITPINPTCNGGSNGSATVSASGGTGALSYAWSSGTPNGSSVTNLSAGAITVTVTDASGCTGTATANLTAPPPVTASITPTNPLCNGATSGSCQHRAVVAQVRVIPMYGRVAQPTAAV